MYSATCSCLMQLFLNIQAQLFLPSDVLPCYTARSAVLLTCNASHLLKHTPFIDFFFSFFTIFCPQATSLVHVWFARPLSPEQPDWLPLRCASPAPTKALHCHHRDSPMVLSIRSLVEVAKYTAGVISILACQLVTPSASSLAHLI